MPPVEFEPTISAGERPQTYALDRAATETGIYDPTRPLKDISILLYQFPFASVTLQNVT